MNRNIILVAAVAVVVFAAFGVTGLFTGPGPGSIDVCTDNGKPVVRLFSTTRCPHCIWIGETYESVVKEYVDRGEIVAYHWELDANDDSLTGIFEGHVPPEEVQIYQQVNPRTTIPTFVFGCKYYRIGNGYETQEDLASEEKEFREIIEAMIEGREPGLTTFKAL